jgi:hypothetical protein
MRVRCISLSALVPSLNLLPPIASISSMKITHGCVHMYSNSSSNSSTDGVSDRSHRAVFVFSNSSSSSSSVVVAVLVLREHGASQQA